MPSSSNHRISNWLLRIFSVVSFFIGLYLAVGGAWLAIEGGSYYYLIAGATLILTSLLLYFRQRLGLWLFALLFLGTLGWTIWESGLDYWRWVPRMGVPVLLGLILALLLPSFNISRRTSFSLAGAFLVIFVGAFCMAFVPTNWTHNATTAEAGSSSIKLGRGNGLGDISDDDWPVYGRDNNASRYSPITDITPENVSSLKRAWQYRTRDIPSKRYGAETTPIKIDDKLYLCSARNQLIALSAESGEEIWRYDPKVADEDIPYTAACRGVAYYKVPNSNNPSTTQACNERIVSGTLDGRIIEVDAQSGKPCLDFGNQGEVDIKKNMGKTPSGFVAITGVPVIVQGVIITGHQVLDGQKRYAPSGVIKGFDVQTGELRWAWDMEKPYITKLPPEGETYTRGTPNMWTSATGDNDLGLAYLPMGNSSADYWSSSRTSEELKYSTSLVAMDVNTGKPAWSFQTVHKDVWDYDLGSQVSLIDYPTDNGPIPAVVLPSKQGDIYVLNRETGELLTGVEDRKVPTGGVGPEKRSSTQPFSTFHTLRKPDLTARDMWGVTMFDQLACRIQFQKASYKGIYTPPTTDQHWIQYPGYNGGSDWGSVAIDPSRGVLIANYNDMPNFNRLVSREEANERGWKPRDEMEHDEGGPEGAGDPQQGTPYAVDVNAGWRLGFTELLCKQPPYGGIRAISLEDGSTLWDRPLGTARNNGPFGFASGLPLTIGTPNNGGSVVTKSGLIFIAAATDNLIRAIDINTGETVWQDALPAGGQANPMMYRENGKSYLVIVAAGHHFMETPPGDYVIAYALDQ
ncbi:membrane-bound PQQ-dependent dehydrogenase, glucose/quinate/shikimate family [Alteromonas sp. K632G]|uniref:membrane-bound PQQ-dependent dehydrogenase, glucose/quinate/shikimate family n=1 Tax=unclassified Alteromonas TaxID=2614992 RepID=UPI00163D352F|nr:MULTISPECIES: membrane-bound PQQ-dependent dehydrogenase, glucose/quinate/shikimate family [unclassified Alteromonas]MBO7924503.1 membrane-bound PQQ-dependent dehydrogenase, glucose/quinate/shikimate family [Alteromonas sp. K632G]